MKNFIAVYSFDGKKKDLIVEANDVFDAKKMAEKILATMYPGKRVVIWDVKKQ